MKSTAIAATAIAACLLTTVNGADSDIAKKWSYKTNDTSVYGPAEWGKLYPACDGKRQSPIDLTVKTGCKVKKVMPLVFAGECPNHEIQQNHFSFAAEAKNGSTCSVTLAGEKFSFFQSHAHAPAEHKVNGRTYDAELHFVHKAADKLLVVGLFLEKQPTAVTDPFFQSFWSNLEGVSANKTVNAKIDPYIPMVKSSIAKGRVFNYPGSLTSPGCNETVDWWIVERPIAVATTDFDAFTKHLGRLEATDQGRGARPPQPLNGREVVVY